MIAILIIPTMRSKFIGDAQPKFRYEIHIARKLMQASAVTERPSRSRLPSRGADRERP